MADAIIFDFRRCVLFFFSEVLRRSRMYYSHSIPHSFRLNEGTIYDSNHCYVVVDNIM